MVWLYRFFNIFFFLDGGAFFSPNGKKIVFRARHPTDPAEIRHYQQLLKYNLVAPTRMEIFTIDLNGKNLKQITNLGGSNWSPSYLTNNQHIIFSTNFNNIGNLGAFDLYLIRDDGTDLKRVFIFILKNCYIV